MMDIVSAQVSIYPLRQAHLGPGISKAIQVFHNHGLTVRSDAMSTLIAGEPDAVIDGLKEAFRAAATLGEVAMVVTLSNACIVPSQPAG